MRITTGGRHDAAEVETEEALLTTTTIDDQMDFTRYSKVSLKGSRDDQFHSPGVALAEVTDPFTKYTYVASNTNDGIGIGYRAVNQVKTLVTEYETQKAAFDAMPVKRQHFTHQSPAALIVVGNENQRAHGDFRGSVIRKTEPAPSALVMLTRPSCNSARRRTSASPKPVPSSLRRPSLPTCRNSSNTSD